MIYYFFTIVVLYILYRFLICEEFYDNIYLSKSELEKTLINNKDNYYDTFNNNDFRVRNIENINEYNNIIKNACISISLNYSKILDDTIKIANKKISQVKINGFDGKKASKIQWSIGIFKGKKYEYGLPHTRNFIILLPENIIESKNLLEILIHEKIHIYQKMYPNDIKIWLKDNGFKKYRIKNKEDNTRANPDIDNYIYKNSQDQILISKYNDLPLTINDVKYYPINDYKYEHPFEYMAYSLEYLINNKLFK